MNCKELEKLVPLYHDGELSEAERKEFELHLSGCPECRKMLASLATLDELVRDGEAEKVPDPGEHYWQSFSQRVTHRLSEPRHLAVRRHRPKFFGLKLIPYLSAGVAVVFGIIIGIDLLQKAPGRFSQLKKIDELGSVQVEKDEGISRKDLSKPASPVNSRLRSGDVGYGEIADKFNETPPKALGRALGQEDIVTESALDAAEIATGSVPTEAEATKTKDEVVKPEEKIQPVQNLASKEETAVKPGVTAVTTKQSVENQKVEGGETGRSQAREQVKATTGGAAKTPAVGGATEAQKVATIAVDKTYPKGAIVFDRQFQPSGTLRVVVDSTGKLAEVVIYKSSGNASIDTQAIQAYKKQWSGQVLRQRQATLYVPFSQTPPVTPP